MIAVGMSKHEVDGILKYYNEKEELSSERINYYMKPKWRRLWIDLAHTIRIWFNEEGRVYQVETADL